MKHKSGINDLYIINSYNTILYCTKKKKKKFKNQCTCFTKYNKSYFAPFFSTLTHFEHVAWHGYSLALHISKKTISLFQNSGQWGNPFGTQRLVHLGSAWAVTTFIIFCWTVCFFFFFWPINLCTMQAEKQKSWKIYIHAKAKSFHFKLKATSIIPTWEFHHCSILLKLGKCILRLKSEYGTPINPKQPQCKTLRSKFIGFLKMFRFRRSKNRAIGFKHKSDLPHPEARFRKYHLGWLAYKV